MDKLVIVGTGREARTLAAWVDDCAQAGAPYRLAGFLAAPGETPNAAALPAPLLGRAESYEPGPDEVFVPGMAAPKEKERAVAPLLAKTARFAAVVHPTANLARFCTIGRGAVIYPFATISDNAVVGDFATILFSGLGHDARAGAYSTVGSGCDMTGGASLGERCSLGAGAVVLPHKAVGDGAIVAPYSVVMRNVKPGTAVEGNPARLCRG